MSIAESQPQNNHKPAAPTVKDFALQLAAIGWLVFPCKPDKRPATKNGFKDATTDPQKIKAWTWPLIGIYCEGSGLFAVDIDMKNGIDGLATWTDLLADESEIVNYGPSQTTPTGGRHYLFKMPPGLKVPNNAGKLGPGLDLRSTGYICTGPGYQWVPDYGPDRPLTKAPAWLLDRIAKMQEKPAALPMASEQTEPVVFWLNKYLAEARPGNRNNEGFLLACQLRDSGVGPLEARAAMVEFAARVTGDGYTEKEALASWESAYLAPAREPATLPGAHRRESYAQEAPQTAQAENSKDKRPTDDELRDRWIARAPMTSYGLGCWRRYAGGVWGEIQAEIVLDEITTVLEKAKIEGVKPRAGLLASVLELARIKRFKGDDIWDCDSNLIFCKNGALHIPTMTLLQHDPQHYATGALSYDYDPKATAPTWRYFLDSTLPGAADFLQEFAGYCLTTDTRFETAVWLQGPRGSGKSTAEEGFIAMLGDRHTVLGLADIEKSRFSLWDLRGKTLAVASEQPALYMQSSHILNAIISGETLKVERKFRDPVTIRSHAKIMWAMNELPRVPDAGNGLFRRVKVIKFPNLAADKRNPAIKETIKTEGAGILNWALEGLRRLLARGRFDVPASVQNATDHFQETNDIPAVFLAECCIIGTDYKTKSSLLYEKYSTWCLASGHKPKSSTAIADDWDRLGLEKKKETSGMFWHGIGLLSDEIP